MHYSTANVIVFLSPGGLCRANTVHKDLNRLKAGSAARLQGKVNKTLAGLNRKV